MSEDSLTHCEQCGTEGLRRVITTAPHTSVKNYDTIGKLADKNWRSMGHYEKEEVLRRDKVKEKQERKEKQQKINKLAKMNKEQLNRWIINGD